MFDIGQIAENVMMGRVDRNSKIVNEMIGKPGVKELTQMAIDEGVAVEDILNKGLMGGMNVIGEGFKKGERFIPEVLMSAQAMKVGMEIIKPILVKSGIKPIGNVAIGTVKGDVHDIGKTIVAMMMESAGLRVIDLGIDVPAQKFIEVVNNGEIQMVAMSALLTTTMEQMKVTIEALAYSGLRDRVKVIVGGAPVSQSYAHEIGADMYAPDAVSAAEKVKQFFAEKNID